MLKIAKLELYLFKIRKVIVASYIIIYKWLYRYYKQLQKRVFLQAKQRFIFRVSENAFRFGSDPNVSAKRTYGKKTVPIWMSMFTLASRRLHFRACTAYQCDTTGSEKYLIICAHPSTVYACDESHDRVSCFYPKEKKKEVKKKKKNTG